MNTADISVNDEFDGPDEDERRTIARRLFTYSTQALVTAAVVEKIFVKHPAFQQALEGCDRVFQLGRELTLPQGVVVAGTTGVGKTALIRYFRNSLPASNLFERDMGAIAVRLPAKPNVGHLVGNLLEQLHHPFPNVSAHTLSIKRRLLKEALRHKGTRLLFVDEAHHLEKQARLRTRQLAECSVTDVLRELMDEVPLGLCLAGAENLLALDNIDPHLASRMSARFQLIDFSCGALWHGFLRAFRRQCSVMDLSILEDKLEAEKLHRVSVGNPRDFKRLIVEAVLVAFDEASTVVSVDHVRKGLARVRGGAPRVGCPYAQ